MASSQEIFEIFPPEFESGSSFECNYKAVNDVLATCTVAKDSTLANDYLWWAASHPIQPLDQSLMCMHDIFSP